MRKNKSLRLVLLGFITWLVPFVASFGFYDRLGNLNVSYGFFKSVMVVISSITGMFVLFYHLKLIHTNYMREGFIAGMVWLVINYVLDIFILIPMAGMTLTEYFSTIGLGYLQIPVISTSVGMILQRKTNWSK
jgi:hypothetical protein